MPLQFFFIICLYSSDALYSPKALYSHRFTENKLLPTRHAVLVAMVVPSLVVATKRRNGKPVDTSRNESRKP